MIPTHTTVLTLLLAAALGSAHAQDRGVDAHNITTRSTITGSLTQTAAGLPGQSTQQTIAIGGVSGKVNANDISATANVVGAITQATTGASRQNIGIGSVQGNVDARNVTVNGTAIGAITQSGLGRIDQRIGIGSVQGTVNARNITATGVTGGLIAQTGSGTSVTDKQLILVGGVSDVDGRNLTATGAVGGVVTQTAIGAVGGTNVQQLLVGSINDSQVHNVTTNGAVLGFVTQVAGSGLATCEAVQEAQSPCPYGAAGLSSVLILFDTAGVPASPDSVLLDSYCPGWKDSLAGCMVDTALVVTCDEFSELVEAQGEY